MQMPSVHVAAQPTSFTKFKVPRARLARLEVESELCPQVLLRVLGLLARHWVLPLSIEAVRGGDALRMTVEIETLPEPERATLVARIEAIVAVRTARIT